MTANQENSSIRKEAVRVVNAQLVPCLLRGLLATNAILVTSHRKATCSAAHVNLVLIQERKEAAIASHALLAGLLERVSPCARLVSQLGMPARTGAKAATFAQRVE